MQHPARGADLVYPCGKGHAHDGEPGHSVATCSPVTEDGNADAGTTGTAVALGGSGAAAQPEPQVKPKLRPPSDYLWAALIARMYEVFPLICPMCGRQMRIIAFITFSADIHKILDHVGVWIPKPRALRQHAGHRWGMTVVRRRRGKVLRLCRTGSWQTNHRPTIPTISAPLGEFAAHQKAFAKTAPG